MVLIGITVFLVVLASIITLAVFPTQFYIQQNNEINEITMTLCKTNFCTQAGGCIFNVNYTLNYHRFFYDKIETSWNMDCLSPCVYGYIPCFYVPTSLYTTPRRLGTSNKK